MIVFRLSCEQGHAFEGWFASAEAFDRQQEAGQVSCPLCESVEVTRLPSAPYVNTGSRGSAPAGAGGTVLNEAALGKVIAALKAHIMANTEDVGRAFPEIARRMHYGEESERGIRGHVSVEEAQALAEEGIPAVALPPVLALGEDVH